MERVFRTSGGAILVMLISTIGAMTLEQPALASMGVGVGILMTVTMAFAVLHRKIEKLEK